MKWLIKLKLDTLLALQFFSILPINRWYDLGKYEFTEKIPRPANDEQSGKLNDSVAGFPLAGLIIAIPPAIIWYISNQFVSSFLAATIAICFGALITGALHEDGLADWFDSLGAGSNKLRSLEIMRDSTIGIYGATALFFSFTLRILALSSLSSFSGAMALLMAHSVARGSILIAIYKAEYVRPKGLGNLVSEGINTQDFQITMVISFAISLLLSAMNSNLVGLIAPIAGLLSAWIMLQWLVLRLDGYSGDGLGAMEQIAEITVLICLAGLWQ